MIKKYFEQKSIPVNCHKNDSYKYHFYDNLQEYFLVKNSFFIIKKQCFKNNIE